MVEKEYLLEWPPKEAQDLNEEPKSKKVKKETDHGNGRHKIRKSANGHLVV